MCYSDSPTCGTIAQRFMCFLCSKRLHGDAEYYDFQMKLGFQLHLGQGICHPCTSLQPCWLAERVTHPHPPPAVADQACTAIVSCLVTGLCTYMNGIQGCFAPTLLLIHCHCKYHVGHLTSHVFSSSGLPCSTHSSCSDCLAQPDMDRLLLHTLRTYLVSQTYIVCFCRGGIPICFPNVGPHHHLPTDGFLQDIHWSVADSAQSGPLGIDPAPEITLFAESDDHTLQMWPHHFRAQYTVRHLSCSRDSPACHSPAAALHTTACVYMLSFGCSHIASSPVLGWFKCKAVYGNTLSRALLCVCSLASALLCLLCKRLHFSCCACCARSCMLAAQFY